MRLLTTALLLFVARAAWAEELRHDFRGARPFHQLFRSEGQAPQKFFTSEEAGLRWRYVAGRAPTRPVGLYWRFPVRGDFTATAHYEILRADGPAPFLTSLGPSTAGFLAIPDGLGPLRAAAALFPGCIPDRGLGAGPELYLMLDNPSKDGVSYGRLWQVTFLHLSTNEAGQRYTKQQMFIATTAGGVRGRLRLSRTGPTLIASVADGDRDPFQDVLHASIGRADVRMIRFAGSSGGRSENGLDMRLLEFHLDAQDVGRQGRFATPAPPPDTPAEPAAPDQPDEEATDMPVDEGRRRRVLWGSLAVVLVVLTALGIWWYVAKARATTAQAQTRTNLSSVRPTTGTAATVLRCTHCGKSFKAKDDPAGKKVKCPGCRHIVVVPDTTPESA